MHSVLFTVVYIKRGGAKAPHPSIRTYTYMHLRMCRKIATSTQGNGSDQLLYRGLYVSANELRRAEDNRLAGMQELNYFNADVGCD